LEKKNKSSNVISF